MLILSNKTFIQYIFEYLFVNILQRISEFLKVTYKRYHNFCNTLLRNLKRTYERVALEKTKSNLTATWSVIKGITNWSRENWSPNELLGISVDIQTSVNTINNFFVNIGQNLTSKVPIISRSPIA